MKQDPDFTWRCRWYWWCSRWRFRLPCVSAVRRVQMARWVPRVFTDRSVWAYQMFKNPLVQWQQPLSAATTEPRAPPFVVCVRQTTCVTVNRSSFRVVPKTCVCKFRRSIVTLSFVYPSLTPRYMVYRYSRSFYAVIHNIIAFMFVLFCLFFCHFHSFVLFSSFIKCISCPYTYTTNTHAHARRERIERHAPMCVSRIKKNFCGKYPFFFFFFFLWSANERL